MRLTDLTKEADEQPEIFPPIGKRNIVKRYLLFDDGCHVCTSTAKGIDEEAGQWLETRSLHDPEMKALLDTHKPGWKHRPTLVIDDGTTVHIATGLAMSARLTAGVGIRRAARIARRITRETATAAAGGGTSRRAMLRATGTGALALLGLTLGTGTSAARSSADDPSGLLKGTDLKRAVRTATSTDQVKDAIARLPQSGFGGEIKETVAFATDAGSTLVMLFFAPEDRREARVRAAVLSHEFGGDLDRPKTIVEHVAADLDVIKKKNTVDRNDFTISAAEPSALAAPAGSRQYFSCMLACVGANCAAPAMRCRGLIFMSAVLACMVAVCGSKARSCHGGCRRFW
ncbi:hypothetical protein SAMN05421505_14110 [Sinosporangium album]|uniref:Uncharacterized protein n=1 Tax=Sinosporangium album TaxID=504805 RepID=A0A1G8J4F0_9ACTN|nr:hypothetical protein [Sinosporangium album]SDI26119.1 hypothetical protein SAMN05421505_14110 [Sinosporangium album]